MNNLNPTTNNGPTSSKINPLDPIKTQHLSEPLQKHLEKLVNHEAWKKFWEELEPGKLVELKKVKILKDNAGWWNLVATTLQELKP